MLFGLFTSGDDMIDDLLYAMFAIIVLGFLIFFGSPIYNNVLKDAL